MKHVWVVALSHLGFLLHQLVNVSTPPVLTWDLLSMYSRHERREQSRQRGRPDDIYIYMCMYVYIYI